MYFELREQWIPRSTGISPSTNKQPTCSHAVAVTRIATPKPLQLQHSDMICMAPGSPGQSPATSVTVAKHRERRAIASRHGTVGAPSRSRQQQSSGLAKIDAGRHRCRCCNNKAMMMSYDKTRLPT